MLATIITIGDEILIGQIVDTNSAWMSNKLNEIGIKVYEIISVSDSSPHILEAVNKAMQQSDIVFITGGLGPTKDDITKATLCTYFDTELVLHPELLTQLEAYFKQRGRVMNESNVQQAYMPANCEVIPNARGTAQGMWFEKEGKILMSMPGVPHEMKHLMSDHVLPRLQTNYALPFIFHKNIMTAGLGESYISERIADIEDALPAHIKLAYLPNLGAVRLRLSGHGQDETSIKAEVNAQAKKIEERIQAYVFGYDELMMAAFVATQFLNNNSSNVSNTATEEIEAVANSKWKQRTQFR
jgi:nicotinamide-nucleotide amidase